MNYYGVLINKKKQYAENDAFELSFDIYDETNNKQSDLSSFKFASKITNDADNVTKKDANYSGGASSQIAVSGGRATVHIDTTDTDAFYGDYILELQMENISSGFRQTVYRGILKFYEEELEI